MMIELKSAKMCSFDAAVVIVCVFECVCRIAYHATKKVSQEKRKKQELDSLYLENCFDQIICKGNYHRSTPGVDDSSMMSMTSPGLSQSTATAVSLNCITQNFAIFKSNGTN